MRAVTHTNTLWKTTKKNQLVEVCTCKRLSLHILLWFILKNSKNKIKIFHYYFNLNISKVYIIPLTRKVFRNKSSDNPAEKEISFRQKLICLPPEIETHPNSTFQASNIDFNIFFFYVQTIWKIIKLYLFLLYADQFILVNK